MDLLCCETQCECRAFPDPVLLNDERVLQNLLQTEERYSPSTSYFECVQKDLGLTPHMRKVVAEWMLEVCEEQKCQEEIFPLAMNYLDRFLSVCALSKNQLQLVGSVCLLVASKLRETHPISAEALVFYTDNSITLEELWRWELLVLSKLKWDISAVTPQDFLRHILIRLPVDRTCWDEHMMRRHAQTFISLCATDLKFLMYTPSMIASASLAAALHGLEWTSKSGYSLAELLDQLHQITSIERDYLQGCLDQIEEMVTSTLSAREALRTEGGAASSNTASLGEQAASEKVLEHGKAGTPTDVRDVHF